MCKLYTTNPREVIKKIPLKIRVIVSKPGEIQTKNVKMMELKMTIIKNIKEIRTMMREEMEDIFKKQHKCNLHR